MSMKHTGDIFSTKGYPISFIVPSLETLDGKYYFYMLVGTVLYDRIMKTHV